MAGMEGFEPPNAGTRTQCLTTWRHPKINVNNGPYAIPPNSNVLVPGDLILPARTKALGQASALPLGDIPMSDRDCTTSCLSPQAVREIENRAICSNCRNNKC